MAAGIKHFLLKIYDKVIPCDSKARFWLYNSLLWRIFPDPIDRILWKYGKDKKRVKFIQIGAFDGIYADNYYKFIRNSSWEGILIEPMPVAYDKLIRNYNKVRDSGLVFLNCAISLRNGLKELYYFSDVDESHKDYKALIALSSFNREHLLKFNELAQGRNISSTMVDCFRLMDVVNKYDYWDLDVLFIDTEGYDYEILRTLDFNEFHPEIIIYENQHLSNIEKIECENLLKENHYNILIDGNDTLAWIGSVVARVIETIELP